MKAHWEAIFKTKKPTDVSWYTPHLKASLDLILGLDLPKNAPIIDIGGGASTLPDDLISEEFSDITVLDISGEALQISKKRLKHQANLIRWIKADVTTAKLQSNHYYLWHDRAVFHFLTNPRDKQQYIKNLSEALKIGGYFLIATFGMNGPLKCSGLEIVRYSAESLQKELGEGFFLEKHFTENHKTPFDTTQEFQYCLFRKSEISLVKF